MLTGTLKLAVTVMESRLVRLRSAVVDSVTVGGSNAKTTDAEARALLRDVSCALIAIPPGAVTLICMLAALVFTTKMSYFCAVTIKNRVKTQFSNWRFEPT